MSNALRMPGNVLNQWSLGSPPSTSASSAWTHQTPAWHSGLKSWAPHCTRVCLELSGNPVLVSVPSGSEAVLWIWENPY